MRVIDGDIWTGDAEAVVVPCNSFGKPKGFLFDTIARYPGVQVWDEENGFHNSGGLLDAYKRLALGYPGYFQSGAVGVYLTPAFLPSTLFLLPTKEHPSDDTNPAMVKRALANLVELVRYRKCASVAVPAIGCDNADDFASFEILLSRELDTITDVRLYRPMGIPSCIPEHTNMRPMRSGWQSEARAATHAGV